MSKQEVGNASGGVIGSTRVRSRGNWYAMWSSLGTPVDWSQRIYMLQLYTGFYCTRHEVSVEFFLFKTISPCCNQALTPRPFLH